MKHIDETSLRKVFELIQGKVNYLKGLIDGLATVARTGSYNDLTDKPASSLPSVSAADEGKVLAVSNGAWSAGNPYTKPVAGSLSLDEQSQTISLSLSLTAKQLYEILRAGVIIPVTINDSFECVLAFAASNYSGAGKYYFTALACVEGIPLLPMYSATSPALRENDTVTLFASAGD